VPLEVWPQEKRVAWIEERVRLHMAADAGQIPPCTDDERWLRDEGYAVFKKGNKRAKRVLPTELEAQAYIGEQLRAGEKDARYLVIEHRPGRYARCEGYCPVGGQTGLCPQWTAELAKRKPPEDLEGLLADSLVNVS
jgi:hypothetical protein